MPKGSGPKMPKAKPVLADARAWATKHRLFGAQAFLRYVILRFTENLNQVSDEFVFKGGNLLWVYIDTPRATTDLDLATMKVTSHSRVQGIIEKACLQDPEIRFSVHSFKEIEQEGKAGAAVTIGYATDQGARNRFEIDIVYGLATDVREISSPVRTENRIRSATVENIIADKVSACHRFKSGNTRMKDFDDLWRLSKSGLAVRRSKLRELLERRAAPNVLDPSWINPELEKAWKAHTSRYKDLPAKLEDLFHGINEWLKTLASG